MASSSMQPEPQPWASTVVNAANFVPTKLWLRYKSSNYPAWREQMHCILESQGLLGFIDGTNPPPPPIVADATTAVAVKNRDYFRWIRTDAVVKGWILCSLNDDIIDKGMAFRTSRGVWLELENKFGRPHGRRDGEVETEKQEETEGEDVNERYLILYRAALEGNWEAAKQIFDEHPEAMTARIDPSIKVTALQIAVGAGKRAIHFVEKLVAVMPEDSIAAKDKNRYTALSFAAAVGNIEAATILVNRMPDLLYIPDRLGRFPLQTAALHAHRDMLKYLISVTRDDAHHQNPYAASAGLILLIFVIDAEFLDIALYLVEKYPDLARLKLPDNASALKKITSKKSVFVSEGRFNFWERCISSCEYCLN
ncbi:hypothetical protein Salat_1043000 [Sesamum alatum]|uniref:Uncharacterized protein n=1 Tax=Sesamum alatum TaxID=300844 RepID=A0AAE1YNC6_9LAMI|nr:hypothetical protein Salat_1043000 [Sesamum alatum]